MLDLLFHLPDSYVDRSARPTLRARAARHHRHRRGRRNPPTNPRKPQNNPGAWSSATPPVSPKSLFFPAPAKPRPPSPAFPRRQNPPVRQGRSLQRPPQLPPPRPHFSGRKFGKTPRVRAGLAPHRRPRHLAPPPRHPRRPRRHPPLPEWQSPDLLAREAWPPFADALRQLHAPTTPPSRAPRLRLAYDEMFAQQLAYGLSRRETRDDGGRALIGTGAHRATALARFGHALTASQTAALAEIDADLAAPRRMLRLLQGDVGSGKTLVALLAMLTAAEAGYQAALMAPTRGARPPAPAHVPGPSPRSRASSCAAR